jgi:Mechanosensitive ion channel
MFDEALTPLHDLGGSAAAILPSLLVGLVIFGLGLLVARAVRAAARTAAALREASADVAAVLGRIAGGFATMIAFLVAASVTFPSVSAADLFNLLGIGGVAIGFAFRDVLQNLLAGILILLTRGNGRGSPKAARGLARRGARGPPPALESRARACPAPHIRAGAAVRERAMITYDVG